MRVIAGRLHDRGTAVAAGAASGPARTSCSTWARALTRFGAAAAAHRLACTEARFGAGVPSAAAHAVAITESITAASNASADSAGSDAGAFACVRSALRQRAYAWHPRRPHAARRKGKPSAVL